MVILRRPVFIFITFEYFTLQAHAKTRGRTARVAMRTKQTNNNMRLNIASRTTKNFLAVNLALFEVPDFLFDDSDTLFKRALSRISGNNLVSSNQRRHFLPLLTITILECAIAEQGVTLNSNRKLFIIEFNINMETPLH